MPISKKLLKDIRNNNPELTRLRFKGDLTLQEVIKLTEALKVNKTITELDFTNCNLGDNGAKAIAKVLKFNKTITDLGFRDCNIGNNGAKAIAEVLKISKTLENLRLLRNKIDNEGAKAIAEVLKFSTIAELELYYNNLTTEGEQAINKALKTNKSIIRLFLNAKKEQWGVEYKYTDRNYKLLLKVVDNFIDISQVKVDFNDQAKKDLSFKKLTFMKLYQKCSKGQLKYRLTDKLSEKVIKNSVNELIKAGVIEKDSSEFLSFCDLNLAQMQSLIINNAIEALDQDFIAHYLFYAMITKNGKGSSLLCKLPKTPLELTLSFLDNNTLVDAEESLESAIEEHVTEGFLSCIDYPVNAPKHKFANKFIRNFLKIINEYLISESGATLLVEDQNELHHQVTEVSDIPVTGDVVPEHNVSTKCLVM